MTLIPAIDIINGHCVRLTRGDYSTERIYNEDPVAVAQQMEDLGFRRLHVVDLDGARAKHVVNINVLQRITKTTSLIVDFGGGVKTDADLQQSFDAGATLVTVGSIAVSQPELMLKWMEQYGSEHLILGADVRDGKVSINGWKEDSSEKLIPFLQSYIYKGISNVLCTDISRDGMLQGPAVELYRSIIAEFPQCNLIASGGVSGIEDIRALKAAGIPSVVFGKAIYEGHLDLKALLQEFPQ